MISWWWKSRIRRRLSSGSMQRSELPDYNTAISVASRSRHNNNGRHMEINLLTVPGWEKDTTLLHGFSGRNGGKSAGRYAGLNASYRVGDDPTIVSQNVCDLKLAVGIHNGRIVTMKQVHGAEIVEVRDNKLKEAGEADGMITATPGIVLGVLTADCVPILFVAPKQKVVA